MERLFAPWRMSYVTGSGRPAGCVLCAALAEAEAEGSLVVHVSPLSFVVANLFPYTSGHVMVCPRRHLARLQDATPEELQDLMVLARRLEEVLGAEYRPDGLNLGINLGSAAGAGVADHLHLHVVPRWNGDANFMTVVGATRVIPEEPARVATRLRAGFRS